jgi:hypothetical protein
MVSEDGYSKSCLKKCPQFKGVGGFGSVASYTDALIALESGHQKRKCTQLHDDAYWLLGSRLCYNFVQALLTR